MGKMGVEPLEQTHPGHFGQKMREGRASQTLTKRRGKKGWIKRNTGVENNQGGDGGPCWEN